MNDIYGFGFPVPDKTDYPCSKWTNHLNQTLLKDCVYEGVDSFYDTTPLTQKELKEHYPERKIQLRRVGKNSGRI